MMLPAAKPATARARVSSGQGAVALAVGVRVEQEGAIAARPRCRARCPRADPCRVETTRTRRVEKLTRADCDLSAAGRAPSRWSGCRRRNGCRARPVRAGGCRRRACGSRHQRLVVMLGRRRCRPRRLRRPARSSSWRDDQAGAMFVIAPRRAHGRRWRRSRPRRRGRWRRGGCRPRPAASVHGAVAFGADRPADLDRHVAEREPARRRRRRARSTSSPAS